MTCTRTRWAGRGTPRSERWAWLAGLVLALTACESAIRGGEKDPAGAALAGDESQPSGDAMPGQVTVGGSRPAARPSAIFQGGVAATGCDASLAGQLGETPLRRLTRDEYRNTVRDLLGVSIDPAFPNDGEVGPFDSNAVLIATADHVSAYANTAAQVAELALREDGLDKVVRECDPQRGDARCAERFVRAFGRRAFRHTPSDEQVTGLLAVYAAGAEMGGFRDGVSAVIEATLQSPDFLYQVEARQAGQAGNGQALPLSGDELASRLSFFLWKSTPDEELQRAAEAGELKSREGLRAQAERMLDDEKGKAGLGLFTTRLLAIMAAGNVHRDNPAWDGPAAQRETLRFVDYVVRGAGDRRLDTLLTADFSFPEQALWPLYGVAGPSDYDASQPLPMPPGRAGVFTQASVLGVHSEEVVSPIKRGVLVLNNLMCAGFVFPTDLNITMPPAPPPGESMRAVLESHTKKPECMGCHARINPIGFALDGFDRAGAVRRLDNNGVAIDTDAVLEIGDPTVDGAVSGPLELAQRLARSDAARACMVLQVQRFALDRQESAADTCSLVQLAQRFEQSDYDVRELLLDVVAEDTFRFAPGT
jgi:hypothetical protein